MKGACGFCIEKQKQLPDYCCVLCAIGVKKKDVTVDEHGTVYIDLCQVFMRNQRERTQARLTTPKTENSADISGDSGK